MLSRGGRVSSCEDHVDFPSPQLARTYRVTVLSFQTTASRDNVGRVETGVKRCRLACISDEQDLIVSAWF